MIKVSYIHDIEDKYYEKIAKTKMRKFKDKTFENYYNQYIKSKVAGYELKDLLCGSYEELLIIKKKIGTKHNNIIKSFFNYDKGDKNTKLSKLQPKISTFFETELKIYTCYFCNIEFINKFKISDGKSKNGCTLDHYLKKSDYPYLALSLYNLIPSCYVCNSKVKGKINTKDTKKFYNFSPSSKNFDFHEKVKFKTFMQNEHLQIEKKQDFKLLLKEDFSDNYKQYIEVFQLNGRYEYHKYKVIEMIKKRKEYPDSRIAELAQLTKKTQEEIKQDLFGEYLFDDNLYKRPLSKLIKDISQELGLI